MQLEVEACFCLLALPTGYRKSLCSSFCVCLVSYCNIEAGSLSSDKDLVSPGMETAS